MELSSQPIAGLGRPTTESRLTGPGQVFGAVTPVQNAHRVGPVQVDELLLPLRSVHHPHTLPALATPRRWVSTVDSRAKL